MGEGLLVRQSEARALFLIKRKCENQGTINHRIVLIDMAQKDAVGRQVATQPATEHAPHYHFHASTLISLKNRLQ
jgi:hypothetical protein